MLVDCIANEFQTYYENLGDDLNKCTLPWTMSLMKTYGNGSVIEHPCNDTSTAARQTSQIEAFFHHARSYGIENCKGTLLPSTTSKTRML